jgi:hypothetical protein
MWSKRFLERQCQMTVQLAHLAGSDLDYQGFARRGLRILNRHLRAARRAQERLALRYTAARLLFWQAVDKGASFRCVAARFGRLRRLGAEVRQAGFDTLSSDVHAGVEYAGCCGRAGKVALGGRFLGQLREQVLTSGRKPRSKVTRYYLSLLDGCKAAMATGQGPI